MGAAAKRARRFDQPAPLDIAVAVITPLAAVLFFLLGRYLRAVDNQLADFD